MESLIEFSRIQVMSIEPFRCHPAADFGCLGFMVAIWSTVEYVTCTLVIGPNWKGSVQGWVLMKDLSDIQDLARGSQHGSCKGVEAYERVYTLGERSDDMPKTCLASLEISFSDGLQI